jgi:uncharacterized integral membrane protein
MQIVRTIVWVLLLVALLLFSAFNWKPVEVKIWEGLILETKIPALVVISFLLGLVPMWLLNKAQRFNMSRRISSLETAARSASTTPVVASPPVEEPVAVETDERLAADDDKPRDNLSPEAR